MYVNDIKIYYMLITCKLQLGISLSVYLVQLYGDGMQTRSFQYVSDLVSGLIALMNSNYSQPVNIGNPDEHTIKDFAVIINELVGELFAYFLLESSPDEL